VLLSSIVFAFEIISVFFLFLELYQSLYPYQCHNIYYVFFTYFYFLSFYFLPTRFSGKILRKTSNLGQNFAKDDSTGSNWQNIMEFG